MSMPSTGRRLLIVATDRLSAFDVVLPDPIPDKGKVLNTISNFWFARTGHIVQNHLLDRPLAEVVPDPAERAQIEGRSVVARRLKALPIEAIVRGYLIGTGWKDYQATGSVSGIALPPGLKLAQRLPQPIFTPATKAAVGDHDENISYAQAEKLVGSDVAAKVRDISLALYSFAAQVLRRARHHHRRHQVRVRPHARRRTAAHRRGADARLLPVLAGRELPGGHQPAQFRQAVRARLPGDPGLEQARTGTETA